MKTKTHVVEGVNRQGDKGLCTWHGHILTLVDSVKLAHGIYDNNVESEINRLGWLFTKTTASWSVITVEEALTRYSNKWEWEK